MAAPTTRRKKDIEPDLADRGDRTIDDRGAQSVDVDAELAVIATVLTSPEGFYELGDTLTAPDFAVPAHQVIWEAVVACDAQGRAIDLITVADELTRAGHIDAIGGVSRLEQIVSALPDHLEHLGSHADIIVDKSTKRRVFDAARQIAAEAVAPGVTGDDARAFAESAIFDLGQRASSNLVPIAQAVPEMLQDLAKVRTSILQGHDTGFRDLNKLTGGAKAGQMIVLAARPGVGKSALALQLARNFAESSGDPVLFFSYEMSRSELLIRMLSAQTGIELRDLQQGIIPSGDDVELDLSVAAQRLAALPLLIDDRPPEHVSGLRSVIRRVARRGKVAAVVVDYIQLIGALNGGRSFSNRQEEVAVVSRTLKLIAREIEAPVVALSQLSRTLESRPNRRPMLSDLRESGSIEQDADVVLFAYRDHLYNPESDPEDAELIIAKQRQGETGTIHLRFEGSRTRFSDRPEGYRPGGAADIDFGSGPAFPGGRRGDELF